MREISCCLVSGNNQADVVDALDYQNDLLNIDNPYSEQMVA